MNEPTPITGPGILWAIGQINKRLEKAAKVKPQDLEKPEPHKADHVRDTE